MIAKTVKPATMKVQADDRKELEDLIAVAEENGFALVGKIAKMTGVYVANLIQVDYTVPVYTPSNDAEGGEGEGEGQEGGEGGEGEGGSEGEGGEGGEGGQG